MGTKSGIRETSLAGIFIKLANPDPVTGISDFVPISFFTGEFECLKFGNGGTWCRRDHTLGRKYNIEFKKDLKAKGKPIIAIKLNGYINDKRSNYIRKDIYDEIRKRPCVITGSTIDIEVDHKDGRKNDPSVMENSKDQKLENFQSLKRQENERKRQKCKKCIETNKRYDAKELSYPMSVWFGTLDYEEHIGCKGCFYGDVEKFRSCLAFNPPTENNDENSFSI